MFCLCADEDLGEEIACDLQLNRWSVSESLSRSDAAVNVTGMTT